jgi:hypothetical protein
LAKQPSCKAQIQSIGHKRSVKGGPSII